MKNFLLCLIFAFSLQTIMAQEGGIQFIENEAWESILEKAKTDNKVIFVDAYATWCGPCKQMSKRVFPLESVGEFYNNNFINVKLDVERGDGPDVASHYNVQVIPTYLFVNGEGELVHTGLGYLEAESFISLGEAALDPDQNIVGLSARYETGDRDPEFLFRYARMLMDAGDPRTEKVSIAYLNTQDDWLSRTNAEFVFSSLSSINSPLFDFVLDNMDHFSAQFSDVVVERRLEQVLYQELYNPEIDPNLLEIAEKVFAQISPADADLLGGNFRSYYHFIQEDYAAYAEVTIPFIEQFGSDLGWSELNRHAWYFFEVVEDHGQLEAALAWALESIELHENYYNLDTAAHLYYKLGQTDLAAQTAQAAIDLAKEVGEDYSETQALLDKL